MITRILRRTLCCVLLAALISRDIHRFGLGVVFPWVVVATCFGGLLWLRSRLETRLSRPVYTALVEAVRALPPNTPLVDYETGDRLAITGNRWLGLPDGWWIDRMPREPSGEDAMSDFNLGQPVSTIPLTGFLVRAGRVSTSANAIPVTPPQQPGQPPVPLDRPRTSWWRRLRTLIFVVRTGARQVSEREVSELITQLHRAEPFDHHRDENPEPEEEL